MSTAYVDASALLAIAFNEPGWEAVERRVQGFSRLVSSNLLAAELRAAFHRVQRPFEPDLIADIDWSFPDRPLGRELASVLAAGYLRGSDLWHVASALYAIDDAADDPSDVTFLTLDQQQGAVAEALGFRR